MKKQTICLILIFILSFVVGYCLGQPPCSNSCTTCPGNLACISCSCQAATPIELIDYQCSDLVEQARIIA